MKKLITVLVVMMISAAIAGPAAAAFEPGNLIGAIINPVNKTENGFDLGAVLDLDTLADGTILNAGNPFSAIGDWSAMTVGFAAYDGHYYFATTSDTALSNVFDANNAPSFVTAIGQVSSFYAADSTDANGLESWTSKMNLVNVPGGYAGLNPDWELGQADLGALAVPGGFVDMYLYEYEKLGNRPGTMNLIAGDGVDYQAVLRLDSDGNITVNPVPVPAAVWLLGSGLLGFIGIRRKNS